MASMNNVTLMGNLTRDPSIRSLNSGTQVSDFGLAINETYKNRDGESETKTCFIDTVAWGAQAKACHEHLAKGSLVVVEGSLQLDQWETDKGEKRSKHKIKANRVHFIQSRANGASSAKADDQQDDNPPF